MSQIEINECTSRNYGRATTASYKHDLPFAFLQIAVRKEEQFGSNQIDWAKIFIREQIKNIEKEFLL